LTRQGFLLDKKRPQDNNWQRGVAPLRRPRLRKPSGNEGEMRGGADADAVAVRAEVCADAVEVRVRLEAYEDAATGVRGALCSLTPLADRASDEQAREILAHWSRTGRDAPRPPRAEPERLAAWRSRMEEIGDSFDLTRIGAQAAKLLQDVTGARAVACDGEEALRIFQERPAAIDLVLMDMDMPNLGGWAAAKVMRLARPELRVLITSGYMDPALGESLHEDGFSRFIAKPYSMIDLQAAVRQALDDAEEQ
jgi:CheY-like chemotaxis protein